MQSLAFWYNTNLTLVKSRYTRFLERLSMFQKEVPCLNVVNLALTRPAFSLKEWFLPTLCVQSTTTSAISYPDSSERFHRISYFFCRLIILPWNVRNPHSKSSTILFVLFTSLKKYFSLLLQVFYMLLKNPYSGQALAVFFNFLLNILFFNFLSS